MIIQRTFSPKYLITVFAIVGKWTRKMDILYVLSQIAFVIAFFATNGTFERLCSIIAWHNILVQGKVTWKQSKIRHLLLSMFTNIIMHIQHVLSRKCLMTILTLMNESVGKVNIFNMLPEITSVIGHLSTQFAN